MMNIPEPNTPDPSDTLDWVMYNMLVGFAAIAIGSFSIAVLDAMAYSYPLIIGLFIGTTALLTLAFFVGIVARCLYNLAALVINY